jgi:hypothetical protein
MSSLILTSFAITLPVFFTSKSNVNSSPLSAIPSKSVSAIDSLTVNVAGNSPFTPSEYNSLVAIASPFSSMLKIVVESALAVFIHLKDSILMLLLS